MEFIFIIQIMIALAIGLTGSMVDPDETFFWIFFALMVGFDLLSIGSFFIA